MGLEQLIAAERDKDKIAIEIKTFGNLSFITALYEAVGKYIIYRNVLKIRESERVLFLAVPERTFNLFFMEEIVQKVMQEEHFKIVIYNHEIQKIIRWIQ